MAHQTEEEISAAKRFSQITTIHGIYDIFHTNSHIARLLWLIILLGAAGSLTYQCFLLTIDFSAEPLTTYAQGYLPERFPAITYCPQNLKYVTQRVYDKFGSGQEGLDMLNYLMSFETLSYAKGLERQQEYNRTYRDQMRQDFWAMIESESATSTYPSLELELTADFEQVIEKTELSGKMVNMQKIVTVVGTCYAFEFNTTVSKLIGTVQHEEFKIHHKTGILFEDSQGPEDNIIIFGDPSFFPQNPWHPLKKMQHHFIQISTFPFHRRDLRRRPCSKWSTQDRSICLTKCYNERFCAARATDNCVLYHPDLTREEQNGKLCSWMDGDEFEATGSTEHCAAQPEVRTETVLDEFCEEHCPILCTDETYYVTFSQSKDPDEGDVSQESNVFLKYQRWQSEFLMEEREEFTTLSYVANLGGTIALWCGASLLSVVQLVLFCITHHMEKRKKNQ